MPPLDDLLEITFMGPGLVCILVILVGGVLSLAKRVRAHRAAAIERLTDEATQLFSTGKLAEARAKAEQAVGLGHPKRPRATARAHFCLGRILARLGELPEAEVHLARAMALDSDPHSKALFAANLSLVLLRRARVSEALDRAAEAVRIHEEIKEYPEPLLRAGAGWANVAMSMALTEAGKDGLPSAEAGLAIFKELDIADGLAQAYYAKAHALQGRDNEAAFAAAGEAYHRFGRLHAAIPGLYGDRLADSRKLYDTLGEASW